MNRITNPVGELPLLLPAHEGLSQPFLSYHSNTVCMDHVDFFITETLSHFLILHSIYQKKLQKAENKLVCGQAGYQNTQCKPQDANVTRSRRAPLDLVTPRPNQLRDIRKHPSWQYTRLSSRSRATHYTSLCKAHLSAKTTYSSGLINTNLQ